MTNKPADKWSCEAMRVAEAEDAVPDSIMQALDTWRTGSNKMTAIPPYAAVNRH